MTNPIPDKNIEINGQMIGTDTTLKLSVKTALWFLTGIVVIVMTILSWAYFDLKSDFKKDNRNFIETVEGKINDMDSDIQQIRIDQATIKGDIKLILDRQNRENPIISNPNRRIDPVLPPE